MAHSKTSNNTSIPATLTLAQAIPKIQRQLDRIDALKELNYDNPEVAAWKSTTEHLLNAAFGQPFTGEYHPTTRAVMYATGGDLRMNMNSHAQQAYHVAQCEKRKALLIAAIEQLQDQADAEGQSLDYESLTDRAVTKVLHLLNRFHAVTVQLRHRYNDRETLDVENEYDVQDLLHALLKIDFEDIREEEHAPSSAGSNPRMDFLLKSEQVVIETKKTRKGLADKELGEELIADVARYRTHPDCKVLVCFIYDPDHRVKNAAGLKADLAKLGAPALRVEVIVNPKQ